MRPVRLRTEYLDAPLGLGSLAPRFSWNCEGGIRQTAYRVVAVRDNEIVWDTGKIESSRMTHIPYEGAPLTNRDHVTWTVTLWDENGAAGEDSASGFELGIRPDQWAAEWIAGDYTPRKHTRYPVDHFKKAFSAAGQVNRARLYITARGVYAAHLNGRRIGQFQLAPGSTDYRHRIQYQTYDVTELVQEQNEIELQVADGWFRGSVAAYGQTNVFGRQTSALAQLELTYADGRRDVIATDASWAWSNDGPIRLADLKDGELVDARMAPSFAGNARKVAPPKVAPTASDNVDVRAHEEFEPTLLTTRSGARVLDFGQNIAGFVQFRVTARSGQRIRLRMGETLDENGEFTQTNFQLQKPVREFGRLTELLLMTGKADRIRGDLQATPRQEIDYICGDGVNDYRTSFAVFGFRYALIDTDVEFDPSDFRAVAVYSAMEQTGNFTCSHPGINRLVENTRWSMKGNFLDVPTDCPTRERLGWTGDAQIFFDTGAYLMDVAAFYRKWLRDLRDAQKKSGAVAAVAPYNGVAMMYDATGGSVGWADALVLVPYRFWKRYGDEAIIREFYPMMRKYGEYLIGRTGHKNRKAAASNPHNAYVYEKGMHLGEWLEPEEFRDDVRAKISRAEEATAYLHYTMIHLAEIAQALGRPADASRYKEYASGAKRAYNHLFVTSDTIDTDRQAKLVRPLALGLLEGKAKARVAERLVEAVQRRHYRIGTGFLSTPFVLPVLADSGRSDIAYRMLETTESPSWLAEVMAGATTIWEDWEGKESHNHYSPGAVSAWLFNTVAGIRVEGPNRFHIAPVPGGSLTHASAEYLSPYGKVTSAWTLGPAGV
jgi:alpha-L-rhamnosidase